MARIISITCADWCNVGYAVAKSLRTVGVDAQGFKISKHNFGYEEESPVISKAQMINEIKRADIVIIMNSNYFCLELCKQLGKKNIYVYHTGTTYRRESAKHNKDFNPYIKCAFTDQTEFIGLGMKNENYIIPAIDTEKIRCDILKPKAKIQIAHYPSNAEIKGTITIRNILLKLQKEIGFLDLFDCAISEKVVTHKDQLGRMARCDVYIELFAPLHEGNKYGCFGVTAMEAAALGKIVVTNHTTPEVYERFYGLKTPFIIPQTEDELYDCLKKLIMTDRNELLKMKTDTRAWVEKYHGMYATGIKLKKIICE